MAKKTLPELDCENARLKRELVGVREDNLKLLLECSKLQRRAEVLRSMALLFEGLKDGCEY